MQPEKRGKVDDGSIDGSICDTVARRGKRPGWCPIDEVALLSWGVAFLDCMSRFRDTKSPCGGRLRRCGQCWSWMPLIVTFPIAHLVWCVKGLSAWLKWEPDADRATALVRRPAG